MIVATYTRYSTDKQSKASIEDQFRNCEKYAGNSGLTITHHYKDEAVSGTSKKRPGFNRMVKDAQAKLFDVLLIDDLSRLSRDEVEVKQTLKRFTFWGIRVISVSDGIDTDSESHKTQTAVRGLINEMFLDDLRKKTHRGLTGKALNGKVAGGHSYGYRHVPEYHPTNKDQYGRPVVTDVHREIDEEQAETVRQIFQLYAEGISPRRIASKLNEVGTPSPGASWKRKTRSTSGKWSASAIHGSKAKGTGILNNPLYVGEVIWNRSEWVKDPDTGIRERRERPESEWVRNTDEALRIIPQDLWDRVKARQYSTADKYKATGKVDRTRKAYLFSSLLKCSECGSNYVMVDRYRYGCASNRNGGDHACSNRLRAPRSWVEFHLLKGIKERLLTPDMVSMVRKEVTRLLKEAKRQNQPDQDKLKTELAAVEGQIAKAVDAIMVHGITSPALKEELQRAEQRKAQLEAQLKVDTKALDKITAVLPNLAERYSRMVGHLEQVSQRDVGATRAQIRHLVGSVTLQPSSEKTHLEAVLKSSVVRLLKVAGMENPGQYPFTEQCKFDVVAGAGCQLDLLITAKGIPASMGALLCSEGARLIDQGADCTSAGSPNASGGSCHV